MMPNLKDFIDAMNASWPVVLAGLLASAGLLISDYYKVRYLAGLPPWALSTAYFVALLASAVMVVRIVHWAIRTLQLRQQRHEYDVSLSTHAEKVWDLPDEEKYILAWAVANKQQVLIAKFIEPRLQPLVAKNYLIRLPGSFSVLEWPYRIPDHVWSHMVADWMQNPYEIKRPSPFQRSLSGW